MALGPRCLRCWMFILSGPVDLLVFDSLIALAVWFGVIRMGWCGSFWIFLMMCLVFCCVLCGVMFVNCFVKWLALSLFVVAIRPLKSMVVFG